VAVGVVVCKHPGGVQLRPNLHEVVKLGVHLLQLVWSEGEEFGPVWPPTQAVHDLLKPLPVFLLGNVATEWPVNDDANEANVVAVRRAEEEIVLLHKPNLDGEVCGNFLLVNHGSNPLQSLHGFGSDKRTKAR